MPSADARDPLQRIGRHLGGRRVCCVLDNAEHIEALPHWIEQLFSAAPSLVLLVTSRTRLRLTAEWPLPLAGLAVPDEDSRDLDAASAFDAVRLFEARASAAQRGFVLARHLGAVIDIVEATGGMPLAIELAAAWVRLLPPEEIARELRESIDLLERDPASPGVPARPEHDSLRAVLDRSWGFLAPSERDALAALAVFRGGFTRAAAAAVARVPLPLLSSLVDKSLLMVDEAGRFGMHPLVAAYAAERVDDDRVRAEQYAQRHAEYYAQLAASLASRAGTDHRSLCAGLDLEYANCRLAWHHAVGRGCGEWIAQSIGAWRTFFEVRGRVREGIVHFQAALDLGTQGLGGQSRGRQSLAAEVRAALSRLHYMCGEHQTGLAIARAGIELAEQCADRRALFRCLTNAGSCHAARLQWSEARPCFERTLDIGQADGVADEIATALNNLGIVAKNEGRYEDALACYAQSLAIERERGRHAAVVRCLSSLGGLHLSRREWAAARQCMEEGLRLSELHKVDFFFPIHACGLGEALLEMGELGEAERHLKRALEHSRGADHPIIAVMAEANLGRVATKRGQLTDALERLRAAARIAHERGLSNLLLHIALLFGEWLREAGRPADATRIWHMVAAHPQADAGMRDSARRSIDAQPPHGRDEGEPATLSAVIDQLLSDPAPGSDAPRADKR